MTSPSSRAQLRGAALVLGLTLATMTAAALAVGGGPAAAGAPLPVTPEQLPPPAPLTFQPPALTRTRLPHGMEAILLPDHRLPIIKLYALVKAGSIYDPPGRVGLASLAGAAMETGGTARYPADEMAETLEAVAAELHTAIGQEYAEVSLNVLAKDLPVALPIFADLLRAPAFDPRKVEVERAKMIDELRRQNESPWGTSHREVRKVLYGADSPWARTPTIRGALRITRDDLVAFHQQYFHPHATILAAAGDFEPARLTAQLREAFAPWPPAAVSYPEVSAAPREAVAKAVVMNRGDLTQTTVMVAELSGTRGRGPTFNRDRYAMDVLNFILGGGGFTSILTREIRSQRGLAYTAASSYNFATDRGTFAVFAQTSVPRTGEVLALIGKALREVTARPPGPAELALAKRSLVNNFVFTFQNPGQIVREAALMDFYGYPKDFLATYTRHIEAVTPDDCLRVARTYIQPQALTTFVLGPAAQLAAQLRAYGKVEVRALPEP
ncbi:MAG TPA: pitrilysin family protein [Polyangia bacterium]|jgi:predicted Zn-dependent peptidase